MENISTLDVRRLVLRLAALVAALGVAFVVGLGSPAFADSGNGGNNNDGDGIVNVQDDVEDDVDDDADDTDAGGSGNGGNNNDGDGIVNS